MFKANKLFSLALALVLVLSMALIIANCAGGEESTSTPSGGAVSPKPGATFTGPIDISGKASSGTIQFTVSGDGASITSVSITLNNLKTDGFSAGSMTQEASGPFAITKGSFTASPSSVGQLEGRFNSSTKASGTIDLTLDIAFVGTVELGEWPWSAEAD